MFASLTNGFALWCSSEEFFIDDVKKWNRKQNSSVKRDIILDAAERVFSQKDYHDALLDEIASVAGISKATLYLYFENKIDLFISVAERKLSQRSEIIQKAITDYTDPVAAIKRLIADELSFFSDNAAFLKVLYAQRSDFQLGTQEKINSIRKRVLPLMLKNNDAIAKVIKHGQEMGVFQKLYEGNDFGATEAAFMLTSIIHTCVFLWILWPEDANLIDKVELAEKIFLEGLLVRE